MTQDFVSLECVGVLVKIIDNVRLRRRFDFAFEELYERWDGKKNNYLHE